MRNALKFVLGLFICFLALPALAQSGQTISVGGTVTGTLTPEAPSQNYILDAQPGQHIDVLLSSDAFDAYLVLMDGSGNVLDENDDISGKNAGFEGLVLPQDAVGFVLVVESYSYHNGNGRELGNFTLTVSERQVVPIQYAQVVTGQISPQAPSIDYVFTGEAGDVIVSAENSNDFDSLLYLLDSTGSEVASNDDSGGSINSLIGPFTLPQTDTYTLRATSPSLDAAGSFTLTLDKVELGALNFGEPITVDFTRDQTVKFFTFPAEAGDLVSISANSNGVLDTTLTLNDPDFAEVATDYDSGAGYDPEIFQQLLLVPGQYTVRLQAVTPFDGSLTLTLNHVAPPSVNDGSQMLLFTAKQTAQVVTFDGHAGELVTLTVHSTTGGAGSPTIEVSQGAQIVMSAAVTSITDTTFNFRTVEDGPTVVLIHETSGFNVSYDVSLTRLPG